MFTQILVQKESQKEDETLTLEKMMSKQQQKNKNQKKRRHWSLIMASLKTQCKRMNIKESCGNSLATKRNS